MSSTMSYRNEENCFGFTKQTAMVLEGLGIGDCITRFKDRNISTQALTHLSKNDFITLGVNEIMVDDIMQRLSSRVNRGEFESLDNENKLRKFIEIFKGGKQQLSFIQAFIKYTHMKLLQTPSDYIIDANNDMRASEALCIVANCAILEITDLQQKLREMSAYMCEGDMKTKSSRRRILAWISGIGLSGAFIYTLYCVVGSVKHS